MYGLNSAFLFTFFFIVRWLAGISRAYRFGRYRGTFRSFTLGSHLTKKVSGGFLMMREKILDGKHWIAFTHCFWRFAKIV
jgi:hypothetical protein